MHNEKQNVKGLAESIKTPLEMFYHFERHRADELCFVQPYPDGRVVEYSWREAGQQIRRLAAFLHSLDLPPQSNIALMSSNCAYWIMADIAIWMAGHCSVPLYPVLASKTVKQIMEHSEAKALFVGKLQNWEMMKEGVPSETTLISFPLSPQEVKSESHNWLEIMESQRPMDGRAVVAKSDIATIVYTSGTTGVPKGVMHSFQNMGIVGTLAGELYGVSAQDRKLSYLPLAHAAERVAIEINQLYYGYPVYFADTLETFVDDLRRVSPTIFFAVPRIWTKFQQRVLAQLGADKLQALLRDPNKAGAIKQKILTSLGLQNVRVAVSGAAPLSLSLIEWFHQLDLNILEGYAMTENFAYCHTTKVGMGRAGYVGTPNPYVDCKLSEEGEVLVKSPANMIGYYKQPELSKQMFDENGFLRTGDLGEFDQQNRLKITGRSKELFKTSKGKYVAPAPIENMLSGNLHIELVCVVGANLPYAIAVLNLTQAAYEQLKKHNVEQITKSLEQTLSAVNTKLDKHEYVSHMVVSHTLWTVENGLITPSLKVKRSEIESLYATKYSAWQQADTCIVYDVNDDEQNKLSRR